MTEYLFSKHLSKNLKIQQSDFNSFTILDILEIFWNIYWFPVNNIQHLVIIQYKLTFKQ